MAKQSRAYPAHVSFGVAPAEIIQSRSHPCSPSPSTLGNIEHPTSNTQPPINGPIGNHWLFDFGGWVLDVFLPFMGSMREIFRGILSLTARASWRTAFDTSRKYCRTGTAYYRRQFAANETRSHRYLNAHFPNDCLPFQLQITRDASPYAPHSRCWGYRLRLSHRAADELFHAQVRL